MVHLEYLPGDSILPPESHPVSTPRRVAALPVPLGLSNGVVVFMCGALKHAGPHRAVLVVNGKRRAESKILQVIKYFRLYAILYNEGNK